MNENPLETFAEPKPYLLDDWEVESVPNNPYTPPEHLPRVLHGKVYGHPKYPSGHRIRTSSLRSVSGRVVTTASGSEYELGTPSIDYVAWVMDNCPEKWDPTNPIRIG
jgi:hypothetical protein